MKDQATRLDPAIFRIAASVSRAGRGSSNSSLGSQIVLRLQRSGAMKKEPKTGTPADVQYRVLAEEKDDARMRINQILEDHGRKIALASSPRVKKMTDFATNLPMTKNTDLGADAFESDNTELYRGQAKPVVVKPSPAFLAVPRPPLYRDNGAPPVGHYRTRDQLVYTRPRIARIHPMHRPLTAPTLSQEMQDEQQQQQQQYYLDNQPEIATDRPYKRSVTIADSAAVGSRPASAGAMRPGTAASGQSGQSLGETADSGMNTRRSDFSSSFKSTLPQRLPHKSQFLDKFYDPSHEVVWKRTTQAPNLQLQTSRKPLLNQEPGVTYNANLDAISASPRGLIDFDRQVSRESLQRKPVIGPPPSHPLSVSQVVPRTKNIYIGRQLSREKRNSAGRVPKLHFNEPRIPYRVNEESVTPHVPQVVFDLQTARSAITSSDTPAPYDIDKADKSVRRRPQSADFTRSGGRERRPLNETQPVFVDTMYRPNIDAVLPRQPEVPKFDSMVSRAQRDAHLNPDKALDKLYDVKDTLQTPRLRSVPQLATQLSRDKANQRSARIHTELRDPPPLDNRAIGQHVFDKQTGRSAPVITKNAAPTSTDKFYDINETLVYHSSPQIQFAKPLTPPARVESR
eukprot:TRINITY_DN13912_c0_g1_i1.p1 TRINITY_DN13912_c0_g1~~TRINITY_DN13912_c0_g1_i1.p1  ORF type:complete len:627 (-),score=109.24 TRINITY_DN13912_c0_g1_i1:104-1984(-)